MSTLSLDVLSSNLVCKRWLQIRSSELKLQEVRHITSSRLTHYSKLISVSAQSCLHNGSKIWDSSYCASDQLLGWSRSVLFERTGECICLLPKTTAAVGVVGSGRRKLRRGEVPCGSGRILVESSRWDTEGKLQVRALPEVLQGNFTGGQEEEWYLGKEDRVVLEGDGVSEF